MINIEDVRQIGEPLRLYNFEVLLTEIPFSSFGGDQLRLRLTTASIPGLGSDPIMINSGGHEVIYPGRIRYSHNWRFELREHEDVQVTTALRDWHQAVWNRESGIQLPASDYKVDVTMQLLDAAKTPVQIYTLIGCWPSEMGEVGLSYETSQDVRIPISFSYDYFKVSGI